MGIDGHHALLGGPVREKEQGERSTSHPTPFDAPHILKARRAEDKGAAVEEHGSAALIDLPQSAAIGALLVPVQQVAVLVNIAEA